VNNLKIMAQGKVLGLMLSTFAVLASQHCYATEDSADSNVIHVGNVRKIVNKLDELAKSQGALWLVLGENLGDEGNRKIFVDQRFVFQAEEDGGLPTNGRLGFVGRFIDVLDMPELQNCFTHIIDPSSCISAYQAQESGTSVYDFITKLMSVVCNGGTLTARLSDILGGVTQDQFLELSKYYNITISPDTMYSWDWNDLNVQPYTPSESNSSSTPIDVNAFTQYQIQFEDANESLNDVAGNKFSIFTVYSVREQATKALQDLSGIGSAPNSPVSNAKSLLRDIGGSNLYRADESNPGMYKLADEHVRTIELMELFGYSDRGKSAIGRYITEEDWKSLVIFYESYFRSAYSLKDLPKTIDFDAKQFCINYENAVNTSTHLFSTAIHFTKK
jgi:hypothetical protein